jgi:hypothetical protein
MGIDVPGRIRGSNVRRNKGKIVVLTAPDTNQPQL